MNKENFLGKSKTYIIAEIGINHNADLNIAKRLIDLAVVAGCDAVKFQKRILDVCVPEHQKSIIRQTPWGEMTYLDYKYKMEFGKEEFDQIDSYCRERNIHWSASPWDLDSLEFLMQYDVPWIKIPSAMLTNHELLSASAKTKKKVVISTGMSTEEEIHDAIMLLSRETGVMSNINENIAVLHCNSAYPSPLEELNLRCIQTLKDKYPWLEIGYSGHEFRLGTTVAAIYLGATIIERHITLDRTMWGTDHMASVEPQGLIKLVRGIRELEIALGDGILGVTKSEIGPRNKLRG